MGHKWHQPHMDSEQNQKFPKDSAQQTYLKPNNPPILYFITRKKISYLITAWRKMFSIKNPYKAILNWAKDSAVNKTKLRSLSLSSILREKLKFMH